MNIFVNTYKDIKMQIGEVLVINNYDDKLPYTNIKNYQNMITKFC